MRRAVVGAAVAVAMAATASEPPRTIAAPTEVVDTLVEPASALRSIRLNGARITYRARWSETVLKDAAGVPQATISATSYVREGVRDRATRPLMVFFNGGPGASSSPLHFEAFGPRRRPARSAGPDAPLLDNPASPIDVADLLFVDPVGTGFSRELRAGGGKPYWSTTGDPASVLALLRDWLRDNGRESAPLIVVGQSYGGTRAALMARDMGDLEVTALVLVSPALDYSAGASAPGNDNPYVFSLPTMAVAAWHHGKVARDGRDVAQVWEAAREFAQGDYLRALAPGSALPQAEKERVAARVAALLALPVADVLAANLRVDSQAFLESLLAADGRVVGRLDTRVTAPKPATPLNADRPAAANDPSLGLGRSNVIRSPVVARYFRDELGLRTTRDYFGVTLDVNFNWDWSAALTGDAGSPRYWFTTTPNLVTLLRAKPRARLLVIGGYFDLATPLLGVRHALAHADLPADRVELLALPGSHSPYDDPASLERVATTLRGLATGAPAAAPSPAPRR
jgi:carboxypeptidase C (cathepsin A)